MIEPEEVLAIRTLAAQGWGARRIARELGLARNTVKKYSHSLSDGPGRQERPQARRLDEQQRKKAIGLLQGQAGGNAVVVATMMAEQGVSASLRTVQRAVRESRQALRAAQLATVRFETRPGQQMQIDFGQKWVQIAGQRVRVYLWVAVLGYSRRLYVRASLNERREEWLNGLAEAFMHFGGVPKVVLSDNASALVAQHDPRTATVVFHPDYVEFCRYFGVQARACRPFRPQTKGKIEAGVKYVKGNALAEREFSSFIALQGHLLEWVREADQRVHGTTHQRPIERFEAEEQRALLALPSRPWSPRDRTLERTVANDALVDIDSVRYSVPHRLVKQKVQVVLDPEQVRIFAGSELVATHPRSLEAHTRVSDPLHYAGLYRVPSGLDLAQAGESGSGPLAALGRDLQDYADVIEGGRR
jgi:transposase